MYLDVTFKDGTVSHCVLTQSHTIQIVNPLAQIQDAFSLDGVESIALNAAGNPAATDPTPPDLSGAAEGPTLAPVEITSEPNADATVSDVTTSAPDATITPDPTPAAESASDTTSDSSEPASSDPAQSDEPSSETGSDDSTPAADDHAVAVAAATVSVEAAQAVAASDTPAPDKQAQIQTALADVETALTEWPDSQPLLDAKAQLEALAGEITEA